MRILLIALALALGIASAAADTRTTEQNWIAARAGIEAAIGASVLTAMEQLAGIKDPDDNGCAHEKFCSGYAADHVQVQAVAWSVTALTSTQVSPRVYQTICAGMVTGVSEGDIHPELAAATIAQMFRAAASNGDVEVELGQLRIKVGPTPAGTLLECEVWRRI